MHRGTLNPGSGQVILSFEQRRRDLAPIVSEFRKLFSGCECRRHLVTRDVAVTNAGDTSQQSREEGAVVDAGDAVDDDSVTSSGTRVEMIIYHFKGFTG